MRRVGDKAKAATMATVPIVQRGVILLVLLAVRKRQGESYASTLADLDADLRVLYLWRDSQLPFFGTSA